MADKGLIVVTSIDHTPPDASGKVTFHGKIPANPNDDNSVVLSNVERTGKSVGGMPEFEGIIMSVEEAAASLQSILESAETTQSEILLCVHGNLTEPHEWIDGCKRLQENVTKYIVVPVIWPAESGGSFSIGDYNNNYAHTGVAANAFRKSVELTKGKEVSAMTHSLGNRVLCKFVEKGIPKLSDGSQLSFNNLFMVAADIWEETFNKRVIDDSHPDYDNPKVGLLVLQMVKGKIVCCHSHKDNALWWSRNTMHWFKRRWGQFGKAGQENPGGIWGGGNRLHDLAKTKIVAYNWAPYHHESEDIDARAGSGHSYHFTKRVANEVYNKY